MHCEDDGDTRRISFQGELTIYQVSALRAELDEMLLAGRCCEADLSQVSELDGAGLQLLAAIKRDLEATQREFRLTASSAAVTRILDLVGLQDWFASSPGPVIGGLTVSTEEA